MADASVSGIKLALSQEGGASGDRVFPFVRHKASREVIERRCYELIEYGPDGWISKILGVLAEARKTSAPEINHKWLKKLSRGVCLRVRERWDSSHEVLSGRELRTYTLVSFGLKPHPGVPSLWPSWDYWCEQVESQLDRNYIDDQEGVETWGEVAEFACTYDASLATSAEFVERRNRIETGLFEAAESELVGGFEVADPEENESEGERLGSLSTLLSSFAETSSQRDIVWRLDKLADDYRCYGVPGPDEYDYVGDIGAGAPEDLVERMFEDL